MKELALKLKIAKTDVEMQNELMEDYLPFVKKQISKYAENLQDREDLLSLGMLVFLNCLKQYDESKGSFVNYASVSIRNRIIDEKKYEQKRSNVISLDEYQVAEYQVADFSANEYGKDLERQALAEEIKELTEKLSDFSISFEELTKICPKQNRSRRLCWKIATVVTEDRYMCENLLKKKKLSKSELATRLGISEKTIEKYRKYIVATALILLGNYPGIRAFLPGYDDIS